MWPEDALLYFPDPAPLGFAAAERELSTADDLVVEDVRPVAADGTRLHGWRLRPGDGVTAPVLWLHGNAGNITGRVPVAIELARRGLDLLLLDYRGYGRSDGRPSEDGLTLDGTAAWGVLAEISGLDRPAILGVSLGGAVAVAVATRVRPSALILQSTFPSIRAMAKVHYPMVPGALIRTRFASIEAISGVGSPQLHVLGTADEVVPPRLSRQLHAAAPEGAELIEVPGAGHADLVLRAGRPLLDRYASFVRTAAGLDG